ncbi:myelin protein zero-like protein 3 [Heteronotia binoei]|uniref:myelin protein zero-like protein 3 n=1 Tax=Heteronotia binoei TaxID=13085 RepID=UPI002931DF89|nr:myelin protein zero-like protein 3 [Heteronotia binoei]
MGLSGAAFPLAALLLGECGGGGGLLSPTWPGSGGRLAGALSLSAAAAAAASTSAARRRLCCHPGALAQPEGGREAGRLSVPPPPPLTDPLPVASAAAAGAGSLEVRAAPEVRAFVGEAVVLRCWFRSSAPVTEKLTVDWTYRPLAGGALEPIFHYQAGAYPAREGTFRDRISWAGDVAQHDASIAIASPTLEDNGTFTCSVKNPPDVQHTLPHTLLTVTRRGASFQLTAAGLLSLLVFLPSALVAALLLVRMGRKSGVLHGGKKVVSPQKSSIEVADELERPGCVGRLASRCLQCLDTDEEDPY